jgi:serine/threonine-protein kinase
LSTPHAEKGWSSHSFPEILPGGKSVLLTALKPGFNENAIATFSLDSGEIKILIEGASRAKYSPTGHLVYAQGESLLAVGFDVDRLEITGTPKLVLDSVRTGASFNPFFTFSQNGTLVYAPAVFHGDRTLVWVDQEGSRQPLGQEKREFAAAMLSPDGRHVATLIERNIWTYDIERETLSRLSFSQGEEDCPKWSPTGVDVAFSSNRAESRFNLYSKPADGSSPARQLLGSDYHDYAGDWSPDGKVIAFTRYNPTTGLDLWTLPLDESNEPRPFLITSHTEREPEFSPDGRWIAYDSTEEGRVEVYVQPFPGPGGKWQVSSDGGYEARWAPDGREIYYLSGGAVMAASVTTEPTFVVGKRRTLFDGPYHAGRHSYDVSPNGKRFVMIQLGEKEANLMQLHIVLNWFEELKRLVPTN